MSITTETGDGTAVDPSAKGQVLTVSNLSKRFGDLQAVNDVSFHIGRGETYGLLGPNGAGKSTTISMIAGLLEPDTGHVEVNGHVISTRTTDGRQDIGYVPQDIAIYPDLSARENLRFFGELYGLGGSELKTRVAKVLELIGLTDRANDRTEDFSGGMKRRLNIGLGLLHSPRLLILDEPTVGVDPQSRNAILESVAQLGREGLSVLYTTHYMEEAERLCDRVAIIDEGRIVTEGTRRELTALVGEKDRIILKLDGDGSALVDPIRALDQVQQAAAADHEIEVVCDDAGVTLPVVLQLIATSSRSVRAIEVEEPDLEAVFLHVTGKALRDN
ncbi:MAG: ABC transporter ATP-binding protein [Acidimicrobiia bacterium]|nr:ABC transporter ATP-binding protein [Acidimicrobiia bacterium]